MGSIYYVYDNWWVHSDRSQLVTWPTNHNSWPISGPETDAQTDRMAMDPRTRLLPLPTRVFTETSLCVWTDKGEIRLLTSSDHMMPSSNVIFIAWDTKLVVAACSSQWFQNVKFALHAETMIRCLMYELAMKENLIKVALGVCFALKSWKEYLLLFTYLITLGKDVTFPLITKFKTNMYQSYLSVNRMPNLNVASPINSWYK